MSKDSAFRAKEDMIFWILILAGAGIILSTVFAFLDIDMTSGITAAVLLFAGAQIVLWKKTMYE